MTTFLTKISEDFPKLFQRPDETFPDIFQILPKIFVEEPMMFRSYTNTSEYFLRDYVSIATRESSPSISLVLM